MKSLLGFGACLLTLATSAAGEQFWIEYDASCGLFPEECGWTRTTHAGGDVRSIADGILTLNGLGDPMLCDFYRMDRPTSPGPGETFVASWRVCLAEHSGYGEGLVAIAGDEGDDAVLNYWIDHVKAAWEPWSVPIEPAVFHSYRLESTDMVTYSLLIDGAHVADGMFHGPLPPIPFAIFGDGSYGGECLSLTHWDYFGFGVVPEPGGIVLMLLAFVCLARSRAR